MIVLGLDPSLTAFGWCVRDTEGQRSQQVIAKGTMRTTKRTVPDEFQRYVMQGERVRTLIRKYKPDVIGSESPFTGGQASGYLYALFSTVMRSCLEERKDTVLFAPGQVKAFARQFIDTPDPSPDKKLVMGKVEMRCAAQIHTRDPFRESNSILNRWSSDEADAYWVAYGADRFWGFLRGDLTVFDLLDYERKAITAQHTYKKGKKAGTTEYTGLMFKENDRHFRWSETARAYTPEDL